MKKRDKIKELRKSIIAYLNSDTFLNLYYSKDTSVNPMQEFYKIRKDFNDLLDKNQDDTSEIEYI